MRFINGFGTTDTEEKSNMIVAIICTLLCVFVFIYYIMVWSHVIETNRHQEMYRMLFICTVILMVAIVSYSLSDGKSWWIKFVLMAAVMAASLVIAVTTGGDYLIFVLPIILCIPYYNKIFAIAVSITSGALILLEPFLSNLAGYIDYNFVSFISRDNSVAIVGTGMEAAIDKLVEFTIPCFILFLSISLLSVWLTDRGHKYSLMYHEAQLKDATVQRDLSIASGIQKGMLPDDIKNEKEFEVSAVMLPAKTVGGDFYDFFKIDDSHLALLIADVSGKGLPASLFMASAKAAFRSNLASGFQPDTVMKKTNQILCDSNREKLFVTAWLGIVDLENGRLSYVNAGHNPPFVISEGSLKKLDDSPNFILGRKRRIEYNEHRITLNPGDRLFLYTDGVTEAVGPEGEMYGEGRLMEALTGCKGTVSDVLDAVNKDVEKFVNGVERSDDLTIVVFGYEEPLVDDEIIQTFELNHDTYQDVMKHIRQELTSQSCPENVIRDIEVCSSEILSNIDMYAYQNKGGELGIAIAVKDRKAKVMFRDKGPAYDPLLKDNPDIEKRIKDHKVGGFGLFIVRKMMDEVTYERKEEYNILRIKRGF